MSVKKRGGVWWITFSFRGQRIRESAGKGASKEQAIEYEAKLIADCHATRVGRKPDRLLSEGVLKWLDVECPTLKSARSMESHARKLLPFLKGKTFSQIQSVSEDVKRTMLKEGLEPATINRRLAVLRRVANLAYDTWGWLESPVGRRVKLFKESNARHIYLKPAEVEKLIEACQDPRVKVIVRLAAYTGLRRGEILKLGPENLSDGCIVLRADTKNGRPRIVPLPEWLTVELPIAIDPEHLRRDFERARKEIGRPELHFHDLRHTYASWLVQRGAGLKVVQELLGHATLSVTGRYAHLADEHLREAVKKLGHNSDTVENMKSVGVTQVTDSGARDRSRTDTTLSSQRILRKKA